MRFNIVLLPMSRFLKWFLACRPSS